MTATTSEIIQQKTQRPASEDLLSEKVRPNSVRSAVEISG
jgi:hypothetical protein